MTETDSSTLPSPPDPEKTTHSLGRVILLLVLVLLLAAGLFAALFWPEIKGRFLPSVSGVSPVQERMAALEEKIQALDARVNDLGARVDNLSSAPSPAAPSVASSAPPAPAASAASLAHIQSDMVSLSAAVSGLQAEIKQAGDAAAATRTQTQAALAETVAFMQLRAAAATGHGFSDELAALRMAAKSDPGLEEMLEKLAPYADKGAPIITALREDLGEQAPVAAQAIAVAGAQNWWQRVLARLKGIVSIRRIHGSADDPLAAMQSDLVRDDLAAALDEMKNLPSDAQKVLDNWRTQAAARETIDETLHAMAAHLIANMSATPVQPVPDTP